MTIEEIKELTEDDFTNRNIEVWKAIENLSFEEVHQLRWHWHDDEIRNSLYEICKQKAEVFFKDEIISKLTSNQQIALNYICFDKDSTWDIFRHWTDLAY